MISDKNCSLRFHVRYELDALQRMQLFFKGIYHLFTQVPFLT